jgi:hypothetical protein
MKLGEGTLSRTTWLIMLITVSAPFWATVQAVPTNGVTPSL